MRLLAALVVLGLAAWRVTSLIVEDTITGPWRARVAARWPPVEGRPSWQAELAHCGRCVSVWVSPLIVAGGVIAGAIPLRWWWLGSLAVAGVVALIFDLRG